MAGARGPHYTILCTRYGKVAEMNVFRYALSFLGAAL